MEGTGATTTAHEEEADLPRPGRDVGLILVLLVLAGGLRAWVVARTEVVSRDSLIFIGYSLQLEQQPWATVLRDNHQHPGYPLSVLAVSLPVRYFLGGTDSASMQLSAQLASSLAGVLLVIPMFFLGKVLFSRGAGFWAAVLFQCLPVSGRILSDGLSEALFLLLMSTALLAAVRGVRSGSIWCFAGCGVCSGLAYLTRPEGAVMLATVGLLLLLMQLVPSWRRGWRWTLSRGACALSIAVVLGSPYLVVTHKLTNKPVGEKWLKRGSHQAQQDEPAPHSAGTGSCRRPVLAVWINRDLHSLERLGTGLSGVLGELIKGFNYLAWLPALLGLGWNWKRLRARPEAWLFLILFLMHTLVLWRLAVVASYVSERHVLLLVLCGLFPAVAGVSELPRRLSAWWHRKATAGPASGIGPRHLLDSRRAWPVLLLLTLAGAGLPRILQPLHGNRAGHHAAGLWLARHARPEDYVWDGHFGWARYYSGRLLMNNPLTPIPLDRPACYIIKGSSLERENPYGPTNAQADMPEAFIRAVGGRRVYRWPDRCSWDRARVVVWKIKLPGPRYSHP